MTASKAWLEADRLLLRERGRVPRPSPFRNNRTECLQQAIGPSACSKYQLDHEIIDVLRPRALML